MFTVTGMKYPEDAVYQTPFCALIFIGSFVGEKIGLWTVAGLLLVIGGIVLQEMGKRSNI